MNRILRGAQPVYPVVHPQVYSRYGRTALRRSSYNVEVSRFLIIVFYRKMSDTIEGAPHVGHLAHDTIDDEKALVEQTEITAEPLDKVAHDETPTAPPSGPIAPALHQRLVEHYGRRVEAGAAPAADVAVVFDRAMQLSDEQAVNMLIKSLEIHSDDPNFPSNTAEKIRHLLQGYKVADMEQADWSFDIRTLAAMIHYHSPYPEVRSVTVPFDDPTIPVETIRAYFLGLALMGGSTALNTFFSPRQPNINLSGLVLQCIMAPVGMFLAKTLPDWGFNVFGRRWSLNPGPWSFKEQIFATIIIGIGNGAGGMYYTYLVQVGFKIRLFHAHSS